MLVGDSRKVLAQLAPRSVQCCVTSPPYWGLRNYDHEDQIGAEPSPESYVSNLVMIFRGVHRVLHDNGTLGLNIGDGLRVTVARDAVTPMYMLAIRRS